MSSEDKQRELADLRDRVRQLERELVEETTVQRIRPAGHDATSYAIAGSVLGMVGAVASLVLNVVGSLLVGQDPLELIRVYLTFPLGDRAMQFTSGDNGLVMAMGCCLYIGTGMLLGIPICLALAHWTPDSSAVVRLTIVSVLVLAVWVINFYLILSWLQPLLIEMSPDNYIIHRVPPWVAALTHLVFGWTIALAYPLGQFDPRKRVME
jgi:hypothetical protein